MFFHSMLKDIHSIGWDIAIGENGPIFIEGNDNWEALGEGNLGMLMVGNVGINRVLAKCSDFKPITSIQLLGAGNVSALNPVAVPVVDSIESIFHPHFVTLLSVCQ